MTDRVVSVLSALRVPHQEGEYDLHRLCAEALQSAGLPCVHEYRLGPGRRIDLLCGRTGVEIKRGKPDSRRLILQLRRYAQSEELDAIVVVCERHVDVPRVLAGKPIRLICLNRLWGIAL